MPSFKITRQGCNPRADAGIKQEMLTKRLARIKPMPGDSLAQAG
jgi:hypothetical protein